jgi:uncharacterized membrane protein YccC
VFFQPRNYKVSVVFVTIMLVAMLEVAEPIDWHIVIYRLFSTAIGGVLAVVAAFLLWPRWERMQFPVRLAKAIRLNRNYLLQIGHELQFQAGFHARVIADRRKAEMENNHTLEALKRLNLEPGTPKAALKKAQDLAFRNARLTRELTAFSAFLPGLTLPSNFQEANNLIEQGAIALETVATAVEQNISLDVPSELKMLIQKMEDKVHILRSQPVNPAVTEVKAEGELSDLELISSQLDIIAREINAMVTLIRSKELETGS